MIAAKAFFRVHAGVVPGVGMAEYNKAWNYTSQDYEQDCKTAPDQETIFSRRLKEAHAYAMSISNPAYVNWVHAEFLWV